MKLPVSDTRINSSSEQCCAAVKDQAWRMTQPETYSSSHHWPGCSQLGVETAIYRYWLVLSHLWLLLRQKAFSLSNKPA